MQDILGSAQLGQQEYQFSGEGTSESHRRRNRQGCTVDTFLFPTGRRSVQPHDINGERVARVFARDQTTESSVEAPKIEMKFNPFRKVLGSAYRPLPLDSSDNGG
ncbi:hypothetical protein AVEN_222470-1 [Araneus ventricosus]|uniref:Uncharacterized protein n=1 Tax=Araneus ventricosus TaxID=182803 RepID=A0A4Y2SN96_ARAVE|nr:hypothetical protein AVEN_222470-1 [Araneus ventricosus]